MFQRSIPTTILSIAIGSAISGHAVSDATSRNNDKEQLEIETVHVTGKPLDGNYLDLSATGETGSRLGLSLMDLPASMSILSKESMLLAGSRNVQEAVRGAGITAGNDPGAPGCILCAALPVTALATYTMVSGLHLQV